MINANAAANRYTANGTTTAFAYTFEIADDTAIEVLVDATVKTLDIDYSVSGVGEDTGGNVTFLSAPSANAIVSLLRLQPAEQQSSYLVNEPFPHSRVEVDLDLLAMQIQQIKEQLKRGFFLPKSSVLTDQGMDAPVVGAFARGKTAGGIDWATPTLAGALSSPVAIADGGTGATSAAGARSNLLLQSTTTQQGIVELATNAEVVAGVDTARAATPAGVAAAIVASLAPASFTTTVSYTGTASLGDGVGLAVLSGASFALTLPAAATNTGREVIIRHQGTSLSQVYTITGNAAETIDGYESNGNTFVLYTYGETLKLKSNGTSWPVIGHEAQTAWADAGVMTITGTSSNPTKPTTPDYDHVFWRRNGKEAQVKWVLQTSSAAGGADGSGAYLFATPAGIAIDSVLPPVPTAYATATMSEGIKAGVFSCGRIVQDSVAAGEVIAFAFDTTHMQWAREGTGTPVGSASYAMTSGEMGYYMEVRFQAANWRV